MDTKPIIPKCDDFKQHFQSDMNEIRYGNVVIKKVEHKHEDISMQPMPVLDFIKTIKDEPDDHTFDDVGSFNNIFVRKLVVYV